MLGIDRINWTTMIAFTGDGIQVADYTQIRAAVTDMFKQVYGDDIDVSTASADGVYVENYSLIINNILQSLKSTFANLNVNEASGHYLDVLASLTNVYRKAPTRSTASLTVELAANQPDYVVEEISFVDQAGIVWTCKASDTQQETLTFKAEEPKSIVVVCEDSGPVRAPAGWIDRLTNATVVMSVEQSYPAVEGQPEETDAQLRSRRSSSVGTAANSVLEALVGELFKISGILDVKVYNNDYGQTITAKDGTVIQNHDVYVLLRRQPGIAVSDALVGTTIYENMTPGIKTTVGNKYFTYQQYFLGEPIELSVPQNVFWKEVSGIHPEITIRIEPRQNFSSATTPEKVGQAVIDFANQLSIGKDLQTRDVDDEAAYADPMFRGRKTFDIVSISVNNTVKQLGDVLVVSQDNYFDYSTVTVTAGSDYYDIKIS